MSRNFLVFAFGVVFVALAGPALPPKDNNNLLTCSSRPSAVTRRRSILAACDWRGPGRNAHDRAGQGQIYMLQDQLLGYLKNEINMGADGWVDQLGKSGQGGGFAAADFMFTAKADAVR